MPTPCGSRVSEAAGDQLSGKEADDLLGRVKNLAQEKAAGGMNIDEALKQVAGELKAEYKTMALIEERNTLLTIAATRNAVQYVGRFIKAGRTAGEGLQAFMAGSNQVVEGARHSVDYQAKALHHKFLGKFIADLEEKDLLSAFMHIDDELSLQIYREMEKPGASGNEVAANLAKIIDDTTSQMVAMQNMHGSYITKLPGYVQRQTHDRDLIRRLGGMGNNAESKAASYKAWREFILPLLDTARTFKGADGEKFLRQVHEGLYTGMHGPDTAESEVTGAFFHQNLANKLSQSRVLHFKDAESAFKYNKELGVKSLKDAMFSDLFYRSRNIALLQNFGPAPRAAFESIVNQLREQARATDTPTAHMDSLNTWGLKATFEELTGSTDIPSNVTLQRVMQTSRAIIQMAKMGGVVLNSLADKAFLQSEMAHQGMSHLEVLGKQLFGMLPRSKEEKRQLRLMGVALDGLIGNTISRFTMHSSTAGAAHHAQQQFFNLNLMNWWNDVNKATAGELMAAHLGEHAELPMGDLPQDLSRVLSLYGITSSRWDAIRSTVVDHKGPWITADSLQAIPDSVIDKLIEERGVHVTKPNRIKERNLLESQVRTYFADRIDIAIPTPGVNEKKIVTWGTQAGTVPGEAVRLLMMFKSFPITIMTKIAGREIYGHGAPSLGAWLKGDHKGKFNMAMIVAMATIAGYLSGVARDALKGRTPKRLVDDEGKLNYAVVNEAALRGGGLGIFGDLLLADYDRSYKSFSAYAAGPVLGQLDPLLQVATKIKHGEPFVKEAGKLTLDNTPYINLFYIRPILDYFVLWQVQEALDPGHQARMERQVEKKNQQDFFVRPSEHVK